MNHATQIDIQKSSKLVSFLATAILLVGCGSGGSPESSSVPTSPRAESTLSGSAIKGAIQNGLVSAYLVESQDGVLVRSESPIVEPVRSDAFGNYEITMSAALDDATLVIELSADSATRMICDATEGCGEDDNSNPIAFGDAFALSSDFRLSGLVTGVNAGDSVNTHLSPLSHMVVARAMAAVQGLSASNIQEAIAYVESALDLEEGALALQPADITRLESLQGLSKAQLEMGVVSAAILSLVNSPDWDSIEEVLEHVTDRLAAGGELTSVNMGSVPDVTLDDIFYEANEISQDILDLSSEGEYSTELAQVVTETQSSYDEVAESAQQVDPVEIVSQPSAVTVDEGSSVQFSVAAQGGGSLTFQWRQSGQAIDGANSSTLTISEADLSDAGVYDVVVSNSVGSAASLAALLQVNEVVVVPDPEPTIASVDLSWDIPTEREDGSDLELYEIEGYEIVYGTSSGSLSETVVITGGGQTEATITELGTGTYYFAIATVDSDGVRGAFSSEIQQTIL